MELDSESIEKLKRAGESDGSIQELVGSVLGWSAKKGKPINDSGHLAAMVWTFRKNRDKPRDSTPVSGKGANVQQERSSGDLEGLTDLVLLLIWGYATGAGGFVVTERLKALMEKHPSLAAKIGGCVLSIEGDAVETPRKPDDDIPF